MFSRPNWTRPDFFIWPKHAKLAEINFGRWDKSKPIENSSVAFFGFRQFLAHIMCQVLINGWIICLGNYDNFRSEAKIFGPLSRARVHSLLKLFLFKNNNSENAVLKRANDMTSVLIFLRI